MFPFGFPSPWDQNVCPLFFISRIEILVRDFKSRILRLFRCDSDSQAHCVLSMRRSLSISLFTNHCAPIPPTSCRRPYSWGCRPSHWRWVRMKKCPEYIQFRLFLSFLIIIHGVRACFVNDMNMLNLFVPVGRFWLTLKSYVNKAPTLNPQDRLTMLMWGTGCSSSNRWPQTARPNNPTA